MFTWNPPRRWSGSYRTPQAGELQGAQSQPGQANQVDDVDHQHNWIKNQQQSIKMFTWDPPFRWSGRSGTTPGWRASTWKWRVNNRIRSSTSNTKLTAETNQYTKKLAYLMWWCGRCMRDKWSIHATSPCYQTHGLQVS